MTASSLILRRYGVGGIPGLLENLEQSGLGSVRIHGDIAGLEIALDSRLRIEIMYCAGD
jgi:hypothetical protein